MDNNKIKYGLKNVHYSIITEESDGTYSYNTPTKINGAVNLSLKSKFERTAIPADDDPEYAVAEDNKGYEGEIEFEKIPDDFREYVLGEDINADGVLVESSEGKTKPIALMFEFDGDSKKTRHLLYYCRVSKPDIESSTKGEKLEPKTDKLAISVIPHKTSKRIKAKCSVGDSAYNNWFNSVYEATRTTTITPSAAIFDKKTANQKEIVVNVIPISTETLSNIKNNGTALTTTTHYTNASNVITIKTAYLSTLPVGVHNLEFTFSNNYVRTLKISVIDTTV